MPKISVAICGTLSAKFMFSICLVSERTIDELLNDLTVSDFVSMPVKWNVHWIHLPHEIEFILVDWLITEFFG